MRKKNTAWTPHFLSASPILNRAVNPSDPFSINDQNEPRTRSSRWIVGSAPCSAAPSRCVRPEEGAVGAGRRRDRGCGQQRGRSWQRISPGIGPVISAVHPSDVAGPDPCIYGLHSPHTLPQVVRSCNCGSNTRQTSMYRYSAPHITSRDPSLPLPLISGVHPESPTPAL